MIKKIGKNLLIMTALLLILISVGGCGSKEEKTATAAQPVMAPAPATDAAPRHGGNVARRTLRFAGRGI